MWVNANVELKMIHFLPLPSEAVAAIRQGGPDVHGQPAERAISSGVGTPCRHCLCNTPKDAGMLILAWRPFETIHPYAEAGPLFLCEDDCEPYSGPERPAILSESPTYLLKAYSSDERIIYGTGQITEAENVDVYAEELLSREDVAFVDIRSARNNCFLTRVVRG